MKPLPIRTTSSDRPHQSQQRRREWSREEANRRRDAEAEQDRLRRRARRRLRIALARAPGHQRCRADRQAHRDGVDQREHRLGQPDGGDRVGAEVRDPEHVGDGEDRLHRHLHDHRHREHDDGAADRSCRVVDVRAADRFAHRFPQAARMGRRRLGRARGLFSEGGHDDREYVEGDLRTPKYRL